MYKFGAYLGAAGSILTGSNWGLLDPKVGYAPDYPTKETNNWTANMASERDARNLARQKLGADPVEVEPNKWRSRDGKWQYRAKPSDVKAGRVHLEELDPKTGAVKNVHLQWPTQKQ